MKSLLAALTFATVLSPLAHAAQPIAYDFSKSKIATARVLGSLALNQLLGINVGNGGHVVACRMSGETQIRIEALDIFEGRARGYKYPNVKGNPVEAALDRVENFDRLLPDPSEGLRGRILHVDRKLYLNYPNEPLAITPDSGKIEGMNASCRLAQGINFHSVNSIEGSSDIWDGLEATSKAALFLHEAIYWYLRDGGVENDSRRTRKAVGLLMSGRDFEPFTQVESGAGPVQRCRSNARATRDGFASTELLAYRDRQGRPVFQLLSGGGYRMLTKTILKGEAGSLAAPAIDPAHPGKVSGRVTSLIDTAAPLTVTWRSGGATTVAGVLESGAGFKEIVWCKPEN